MTRIETALLGPEHAAEHVAERRQLRRAYRAWKRLSPAERRRIIRRNRASQRAIARKSDALAASVGEWTSGPFQIPVHAIHMALLPTGKVIFFSYPFYDAPNVANPPVAGDAWIWDPSKTPDPSPGANPDNEPGVFTHVPPPLDSQTGDTASLFCAGLSFLPNGDLFVTGGTLTFPTTDFPYHLGLRRAYTFNPWSQTWVQQPDMQHGRWYPSHVELADGRVAVLAGWTENAPPATDNSQLEIFNPPEDPNGVGTWSYAPQGNRVTDLYPHMTLLGDGRIFLGGPGPDDSAVLDPSTMQWTDVSDHGPRRMYGTEMLDPNGTGPSEKVTEIGGYPNLDDTKTYPAVATSQSIDLSVAAPNWNPAPSMHVARADHNTLWLPDGEMLTVGGGDGRVNGSQYILKPGNPEHQVELFDPATGQWRLGPAQQINRAYHSTAVLLPDGRVLSAGDDDPSASYQRPSRPYEGSDRNSGEIYSPPYLFRGPRPQITSAPGGALYNSAFHVGVSGANPADTHAVLIPPAAVTHATNPNPRIVPLQSAPVGDGLDLIAPANANVAPRGWYMLFVVNSQGVPSVASWVHIGYPGSDASPGPGGGVLGSHTSSRAVRWVRVKSRQSFRKGRFVATVRLTHNRSTISASALMVTPVHITKARTRSVLLAKKAMRRQRAGTVKVVVQLKRRAIHRLLRARRAHVLLKLRISAPGAATYTGSKRISNTR